MLIIKIDRSGKIPLYRQVAEHIKQLIDTDVMKQGDRLPSTRELSGFLELNRTTVYKAYEELWATGYLESRQGAYTTVRKRIRSAIHEKKPDDNNFIRWDQKISKHLAQILTVDDNTAADILSSGIDFTKLSPDPDYIPKEEFRKCLNEVLRENNPDNFQYGNPQGLIPLREFLAKHMQLHGISANRNEIIITNGAQNAVELILKLFNKPGLKIAVENPTYSSLLPLFRHYKTQLIEIPMTDEGMDLAILKKLVKKEKPDLVYTIPNFHNPTGITTSQDHRERLLSICEKYKLPIIEDGFVEELKYLGKNILPVKSMDKHGIVFYVGTLSKVLFPGLRLGWIVANRNCAEKLASIKKAAEISGNTLNQAAVNNFYRKGLYETHIKRMHKIYKKRMQLALKTLRENLRNKHVKYTKPIGGYIIWFEMDNPKLNEMDLIKEMAHSGVLVSPGNISFTSGNSSKINFRVSIAHSKENEIIKGIKILTTILNSK